MKTDRFIGKQTICLNSASLMLNKTFSSPQNICSLPPISRSFIPFSFTGFKYQNWF